MFRRRGIESLRLLSLQSDVPHGMRSFALSHGASWGWAVAGHVRKFWEPRVRKQLWVHLQSTQGADLTVVRDAMRAHPEPA